MKKAQKLRDLGVVRATHMQLLESNLKISSFMEYLLKRGTQEKIPDLNADVRLRFLSTHAFKSSNKYEHTRSMIKKLTDFFLSIIKLNKRF